MRKSIASLCAVFALLACRSDKPEEQVRRAFEACRSAVEAGDASAACAPLDATFQGPDGMDRAMARLFLMGTLRQQKVGATVIRNTVSARGNEALQEVDLLLTGRSGGLLPREASQRSFRLRWRRAGSEWKLLEIQSLDGR
jgi:ketosteroid isomerase-like protein